MVDSPAGFLDTNLFVYAAAQRDSAPDKHAVSSKLIAQGHHTISTQVLMETYNNLTNPRKSTLPYEAAMGWMSLMFAMPVVETTKALVMRTLEIAARFQIKHWDAAHIAAAETAGLDVVYTEDLNHGQLYGDVRVINPFLSFPTFQ